MSASRPTIVDCFLAGVLWLWHEQRDFLLIFGVLGIVSVVLGLAGPNPYMVAGGVALLLAMVFACIVYGSHDP